MAKEKDVEAGSIFAFSPTKGHEDRRDDTFTIPAFLRRGVANAKTETKPQSAPAWKDDDFARIAAAEEPRQAEPAAERPPSETASKPESTFAAKEEASPGAAEAPVPGRARDKPEHAIAARSESAAPLLAKTPFTDIRPILRDASKKYVSENKAAHQLRGAPLPAATPDILLQPRSEIRIEERPSDFGRVEPR